MPSYSSEDIIVSEAHVLTAPLGTTLPDETSVEYNDFADWPAGWELLGYTTTPVSANRGYDTFFVEVQQTNARLKGRKINETLTLEFSLAQLEGSNLELAWHGTATDTAAGVGQKAWTRVVGGGDTVLPEAMFAVEGYRVDDDDVAQPVRLFLYRATAAASGATAFDKNGVSVIPTTVEAFADTSKAVGAQVYEWHIVTGGATS
jgi:hypothetical protein